MKKEEIMALGVDEETAAKVAAASSEELKGYVPKSRLDDERKAKEAAEERAKEYDKQLEELKNAPSDADEMKKTIETLQKENKESAEKYEATINQMKVDAAVDEAIRGVHGKNSKAIKALLNLENAKLTDEGKVKGLDEQLEALTKAEDSSFLFGSGVPEVKGMKPGELRDGAAGDVDFSKMSYSEICKHLENNPGATIQ